MRSGEDLVAIAHEAVDAARAHAPHAEAVLFACDGAAVTAFGPSATARGVSTLHLGVRLFQDGRYGFGEGTGEPAHAIREAVRRARVALDAAPRVDVAGAPFPAGARGRSAAFRADALPFRESAVADVVHDAVERLSRDAFVTYASTTASGLMYRNVVVNSEGAETGDAYAPMSMNAEVRARVNGGLRALRTRYFAATLPSAAAFADGLAEDARAFAEPAEFDKGTVDVVFDADTVTTFVPTLLMQLKRARVASGESRFAPEHSRITRALTLVDASDDAASGRARAFDDEGVATRPLTVVEEGRVKELPLTAAEAAEDGVPPNGKGFRRGNPMQAAPFAAPVNLAFAPGDAALTDLLASRERVILVKRDLAGWYHSIGPTGKFSVVAPAAFLFEHGRLKGVLPRATIGGNLFDALERDGVALGRERVSGPFGTGVPLLLPDLAVAT